MAGPSQLIPCAPPYYLVPARRGLFLVNPHDVYLGRAVVAYRECCELEWRTIEQLIQGGRDAVEVGANIGVHTVPIARALAARGRRLLAVEPQPVVFQNLCANLALNGLFNVVAENAACSDAPGWLSFNTYDLNQLNNSGAVSMLAEGSGNQRVRGIPLDELLPPDFDVGLLKVDVEGFELKVLQGAARTLARCRPVLYLENDRADNSPALIQWLLDAGYRLWWHLPPLFNPDNFGKVPENFYPGVVSANMIGLPRELAIDMQGFKPVRDVHDHPAMQAAA